MNRPLRRAGRYRLRLASLGLVLGFTVLAGCATPGAIGVQDYGTIQGRVVDGKTSAPIVNALVSVGSLITGHTDSKGVFVLMRVQTGDQVVNVTANGYQRAAPITVTVVKDQQVNISDSAISLQPAGN